MKTSITLSFEAKAYQSFIVSLRDVWRSSAYANTVTAANKILRDGASSAAHLEVQASQLPAYQLYAWLERHTQQSKYYGRYGIVNWMQDKSAEIEEILEQALRVHPERLSLDPSLKIPQYVSEVDTHQHRGGLWSDSCDAFAYETSTTQYSFSLFDAKSPMMVYADTALQMRPQSKVILDMGCTIGNSTRALSKAFPNAKIIGIDLCAPTLKLAHLRSIESKMEVHFRQENVEQLSDVDQSVDIAASHWLFHEMPLHAIRNCLKESKRVLKKGGALLIFDMYLLPGGVIGEWLHAGYAARNNEPFALNYALMQMQHELQQLGFENINISLAHPHASRDVENGNLAPVRTHYMTMITATA